jgi:hypothetical protein
MVGCFPNKFQKTIRQAPNKFQLSKIKIKKLSPGLFVICFLELICHLKIVV